MASSNCPICLGIHGLNATNVYLHEKDSYLVDCEACGRFVVTSEARDLVLAAAAGLTTLQRVALSHAIAPQKKQKPPVFITSSWLESFLVNAKLPPPSVQAEKLIEIVGDAVAASGEALDPLPPSAFVLAGCLNHNRAAQIIEELINLNVMKGAVSHTTGLARVRSLDLTLEGWSRYSTLKSGRFAGKYGFLALQFGEPEEAHETFFREHLKPGVKEGLGYDVFDMRDLARVGIIDNVMREKIRDAAFVLVDLTHNNSGAYWEAGFAEGLGKPVLYLCEKAKFKADKSHFDTNHLTTVTWDTSEPATFIADLTATLRRSLNLF